MKKKVLVTGANGQLAKTIKALSSKNADNINFTFLGKDELDITCKEQIASVFKKNKFQYCINCAAYTNVELAESEFEKAFSINAEAVKLLAQVCKTYNVALIHISTDYVFDGKKDTPYIETDLPNPINKYGKSKLAGEKYIQEILNQYYIIRTSWLYSKFNKNFVKTIAKLAKEKTELQVINDQIGSPTNASDLANCIYRIIILDNENYGTYHYSNKGETSWYNFAKQIINNLQLKAKALPVQTEFYPTKAKRPKYTVLDSSKVEKNLTVKIIGWQQGLKNHIND